MYKRLVYLTFFGALALGLTQGQAWGSYLAAYWDGRYPVAWAAENVTTELRDHFDTAGYEILDADQLKTWMDAHIADGVSSVVVFCRDIVPDTVAEENSADCTLRKYLDAGGKVVWYSDMPMYYQGRSDGSQTTWAEAGMANILDIPGTSWTNDTGTTVTITPEGIEWGLTATWTSRRWTPADDTFTVLATDGSGNVAAYAKHFVPGDTGGGFVRIWDFPVSAIPNVEDIQKVAEYGLGSNPYPRRPSPADGALHEDTWVTLSWYPGDFAVTHDVYFSDSFDDVNDGTGDAFRSNQGSTFYVAGFPGFAYPDGLVPGTTYYWRIVEVNDADPNSPWAGPVWSFSIPSKKAYNPVPANGSKFIDSADMTLSWTPGFGAKLHTVYFGDDFDTVANATGGIPVALTTYKPGPLELEKTYYWRVDEFDAIMTHKGDVWSFTTMPDIPVTDPGLVGWWKLEEGGATAVDWSGHANHGTLQGDPQWVDGYDGGALELDGRDDYVDFRSPQGLPAATSARSMCGWGKTYSIAGGWRWIAAYGSPGTSQAMFIGMNGDDLYGGGYGDDVQRDDFWQIGVWHHICLTYDGSTARLYADGIEVASAAKTWNLVLSRAHIGRQVNTAAEFWNGVVDDVRIYNRALTQDEVKEAMKGDPLLAWDPSPANGSIPYFKDVTPLSWSPGEKAAEHDVYYGTDRDALERADASDTTGIYRGRQAATSYTPPEGVEWGGGTFYWRIDEYNTDATISTGRIWSFTVADFIPVDDFESYTNDDAAGEAIWQTWIDGYGIADNGSQVGELLPPYAEQTIVHGGRQSMPLYYVNEAGVTNSEAGRTLTWPRDWTEENVVELSLWYHGDEANAAEPLYVVVSNAVVTNNNPTAAQVGDWTQWIVLLQAFADKGVNLRNVDKIAIGLGSKSGMTSAGGSGTMYIDDIRLYRAGEAGGQ